MTDAIEKFDWVKARHACSIEQMFEKLRLDVKADIETRHELRERTAFGFVDDFHFSSREDRFGATAVMRNGIRRTVVFHLSGNEIIVHDENDKELFRASVTLDNDKQCKFVVGQEQLEEWQFRKKALEGVLFGK